jgi:hypothetical protein
MLSTVEHLLPLDNPCSPSKTLTNQLRQEESQLEQSLKTSLLMKSCSNGTLILELKVTMYNIDNKESKISEFYLKTLQLTLTPCMVLVEMLNSESEPTTIVSTSSTLLVPRERVVGHVSRHIKSKLHLKQYLNSLRTRMEINALFNSLGLILQKTLNSYQATRFK